MDQEPSARNSTGKGARAQWPSRPRVINELLNLREAAERFGLSHYVIYRAAEEGRLHAVRLGDQGRIYYPAWELKALLGEPDRSYRRRRSGIEHAA